MDRRAGWCGARSSLIVSAYEIAWQIKQILDSHDSLSIMAENAGGMCDESAKVMGLVFSCSVHLIDSRSVGPMSRKRCWATSFLPSEDTTFPAYGTTLEAIIGDDQWHMPFLGEDHNGSGIDSPLQLYFGHRSGFQGRRSQWLVRRGVGISEIRVALRQVGLRYSDFEPNRLHSDSPVLRDLVDAVNDSEGLGSILRLSSLAMRSRMLGYDDAWWTHERIPYTEQFNLQGEAWDLHISAAIARQLCLNIDAPVRGLQLRTPCEVLSIMELYRRSRWPSGWVSLSLRELCFYRLWFHPDGTWVVPVREEYEKDDAGNITSVADPSTDGGLIGPN